MSTDLLPTSPALAFVIHGSLVQPCGSSTSGDDDDDGHGEGEPHKRTIEVVEEALVGVDENGDMAFVWELCGKCHALPSCPYTKEDLHDLLQQWRDRGILTRLERGQFLVPGFIDTHVHAPQYSYTGTATDVPLMVWLERYTFPSESRLGKDLSLARSMYQHSIRTSLCQGTTTALYFATIHVAPSLLLAEVAKDMGQRAMVGKVSMDRNAPDHYIETTEASLRDTEIFIRQVKAMNCSLVQPVITPSEELLQGLGALATKYQVMVQSHISESSDQVEFCRDLRHLHDGTHRDTEVFDRCGLLTPRTVLAHGVHLSEVEVDLLRERGTAIAHCPLSNFFFANGVFPAKRFLNKGLKVGLATDVAGGYSTSMLSAIRSAVIASRMLHEGVDDYDHGITTTTTTTTTASTTTEEDEAGRVRIDYKEAVWLATMGGAQALGLQDRVGSFQAGKAFDALLVDPRLGGGLAVFYPTSADGGYGDEGYDTLEDVVQKWVNTGDDRHITKVWVQGRQVKPTTT